MSRIADETNDNGIPGHRLRVDASGLAGHPRYYPDTTNEWRGPAEP